MATIQEPSSGVIGIGLSLDRRVSSTGADQAKVIPVVNAAMQAGKLKVGQRISK